MKKRRSKGFLVFILQRNGKINLADRAKRCHNRAYIISGFFKFPGIGRSHHGIAPGSLPPRRPVRFMVFHGRLGFLKKFLDRILNAPARGLFKGGHLHLAMVRINPDIIRAPFGTHRVLPDFTDCPVNPAQTPVRKTGGGTAPVRLLVIAKKIHLHNGQAAVKIHPGVGGSNFTDKHGA